MNKKNVNQKIRLVAYFLGTALVTYSVFFLSIDISRSRTLHQLWDVGHVFLFILLFYVANKTILKKVTLPYLLLLALVLVGATIIGLGIEYIQTFTGRNSSLHDVLLDVLGALIGFVWLSSRLQQLSTRIKNYIRIATAIITLIIFYPMAQIIADDVIQRNEFPILLSAEHTRELSRFQEMNIKIELIDNKYKLIKSSKIFKLNFKTGLYSTLAMSSFVNNWSEYRYFNFTLVNPSHRQTEIYLRIHDVKHKKSHYFYADRLTKKLFLKSGYNKITISMKDILNAPARRKMDLTDIDEVMLFKARLKKQTILYLGSMWLSK